MKQKKIHPSLIQRVGWRFALIHQPILVPSNPMKNKQSCDKQRIYHIKKQLMS